MAQGIKKREGNCISTDVDSWEGSGGSGVCSHFFFQAEDGIRDVERSRGLGDVYKRQDYQGI